MQVPLKQGLKLLGIFYHSPSITGCNASSIKTRIETAEVVVLPDTLSDTKPPDSRQEPWQLIFA